MADRRRLETKLTPIEKPTYGLNVIEAVEHFSAANPPLKHGWFSVERDLNDYKFIPSCREVIESNNLSNLDPAAISSTLDQPVPMRDIIKESQRLKWTNGDSFRPLPRLLERPQLPSIREMAPRVFINYALLMLLSITAICLLSTYGYLAHSSNTKSRIMLELSAPIYFIMGLAASIAAGRYLFAFAYDYTPYGHAMMQLLALRSMQEENFE